LVQSCSQTCPPFWHFGHPLNFLCLQEYLGKLAAVQAKGDDYEIAAAQIGVEVYSAMSSAVGAA